MASQPAKLYRVNRFMPWYFSREMLQNTSNQQKDKENADENDKDF
jgi:hypothetical protein